MQFTIPPVQGKKVLKLQQHLKPNTNISWKKKHPLQLRQQKMAIQETYPAMGTMAKPLTVCCKSCKYKFYQQ